MTPRPTLRFITCGSVDDGKSTLIGRLLHESKNIFDDQMKALEADSRQYGTQGGKPDFALLVDGLQAEREQGITIDVAYRYFATEKRRYIVADTPGHEQYTRNMATGASTAALAVILVDARKGVLVQTRRHARIVSMMGIRHVVLAINKMDLVGFDQTVHEGIVQTFRELAEDFQFSTIQAIPLSALEGDNVFTRSSRTPWYAGPTLMDCLDSVEVVSEVTTLPFRMAVQWVNRPDPSFRGFQGRIAQGVIRKGDRVRVVPSGFTSQVKEIVVGADRREQAEAGESITLVLEDELDISRGDVLAAADAPPQIADQFEAHLLWMSEQPLMAGRPYVIKFHSKEVTGSVTVIKHRLDVNTGQHIATKALALNDVGRVTMSLQQAVAFEPPD
jgi:bifunctional enzyme CysN/CysC